jgi:hypothetical protein
VLQPRWDEIDYTDNANVCIGLFSRNVTRILTSRVSRWPDALTLITEVAGMLLFARCIAFLALGTFCVCGQERHPKGVHPRATPDDYAVKASGANADYAASLINAEQAKQLFAFDITGKYLVFEIACFPKENQTLEIDTDDFLMKRDKGEMAHEADPSAVALAIQMENAPRPSIRNTQVSTEAHIGYESGRDPVTGQRVNGTYGGGGVGVEHGGAPPPDNPRPGGTPVDRDLLQGQLQERQLPSGKFDHAVAGYLYFARSAVKKDSNGNYLLQHLGEPNAAGVSETVELAVPGKK